MISRWTHILIHHSLTADGQTVSWQAIRRWHMGQHPDSPYRSKPMSDIGYHFGVELIGQDYEILMGRDLDKDGAHCVAANRFAIGICLVGNFDLAAPPPGQWRKALRLVRALQKVLGIPNANVLGHRSFDRKSCPGKYFDMEKFCQELFSIP